ncbi:hypothetical protein MMC06_005007 [Schaereria dolodes]|nr:hypothetical protein [Schaereria dolodes]
MTTEDLLLSDLCKICQIHIPKYRCPRCSIRTCSLPCTKRHKLWAQCNGVRNPATYLKRSELATPKGIDHDYNFISGIERKLDSADRDAAFRGVVLHEYDGAASRRGHAKGVEQLRKEIVDLGVVIRQAPKGMSRSKQNTTKWNNQDKCISWTVEWVHPDGRKEVGKCSGREVVSEAYAKHTGILQLRKKRKKKSKNKQISSGNIPGLINSSETPTFANPEDHLTKKKKTKGSNKANISTVNAMQAPFSAGATATPSDPASSIPLLFPAIADLPNHVPTSDAPPATTPTPVSDGHTDASTPNSPMPSSTAPPVYFYIHAPLRPSNNPVVFPIPLSSTLSSVLQGWMVLEFPTIYILPYTSSSLPPEKFTLAREAGGTKDGDIEGMLKKLVSGIGDEGKSGFKGEGLEEGEVDEREVNEKIIKEVLMKDLKGVFSGGLA